MAKADLEFLFLGIPWQMENFHPVAEGRLDRIKKISRGYEHDFRQVKGNAKIMVSESIILLRIQDFEECRGRISSEIRSDLIHLVHEHRIVGSAPS